MPSSPWQDWATLGSALPGEERGTGSQQAHSEPIDSHLAHAGGELGRGRRGARAGDARAGRVRHSLGGNHGRGAVGRRVRGSREEPV